MRGRRRDGSTQCLRRDRANAYLPRRRRHAPLGETITAQRSAGLRREAKVRLVAETLRLLDLQLGDECLVGTIVVWSTDEGQVADGLRVILQLGEGATQRGPRLELNNCKLGRTSQSAPSASEKMTALRAIAVLRQHLERGGPDAWKPALRILEHSIGRPPEAPALPVIPGHGRGLGEADGRTARCPRPSGGGLGGGFGEEAASSSAGCRLSAGNRGVAPGSRRPRTTPGPTPSLAATVVGPALRAGSCTEARQPHSTCGVRFPARVRAAGGVSIANRRVRA